MQNVKASIVPTQIKGPVLYIMLLLYTCLGKDLYQIVKLPDVSVFDSSLTAPSLQLTVEDQIFFLRYLFPTISVLALYCDKSSRSSYLTERKSFSFLTRVIDTRSGNFLYIMTS